MFPKISNPQTIFLKPWPGGMRVSDSAAPGEAGTRVLQTSLDIDRQIPTEPILLPSNHLTVLSGHLPATTPEGF